MEAGKKGTVSPILQAIQEAERGTSGEIRVHLSQRWFEPDVFKRAVRIFEMYQMDQTPFHNAVLIYVNLRRKQFAILGDVGMNEAVGQSFWRKQALDLQANLNATQSEKAIALAVLSVGEALQKYFPTSADLR